MAVAAQTATSQYAPAGAGTTAGGGTVNPDGTVTGSDGTIYVGGADSRAPGSNNNTPGPVNNGPPVSTYHGPVDPTGKPITQAQADTWHELAALAGPENMPGVDMSGYISAYNNAYNTQMAQIKAGLTASLGQVQQRRDQAAGIVAKMPAKVNSNYQQVANDERTMNADVTGGLTGRAAQDVAGAQVRGNDVLAENKGAQNDTQDYMNLGITANQQADEAALNSSANSAEANAAQQKAQAEEAMYMQQASAATQYANDRQNRIGQFAASELAKGSQPSGIPGLTVDQYNKEVASPSYTGSVKTLNGIRNVPSQHTYNEYTQELNSLTPAQRLIIQATDPDLLKLDPTKFGTDKTLHPEDSQPQTAETGSPINYPVLGNVNNIFGQNARANTGNINDLSPFSWAGSAWGKYIG
jgi:hypothetical protein